MSSEVIVGRAAALEGAYDLSLRADGVPRNDGEPLRNRLVRAAAGLLQPLPTGSWVVFDTALLYIGTFIGFQTFVVGRIPLYLHVGLWQAWIILAGTHAFASLVFGLWERETLYARSRILTRVMLATLTAAVLTYAVVHAPLYTTISRRVVALAIGVLAVFGGSARLLSCWALHVVRRGLVVVGPGVVSNSLVRAFRDGFLSEYRPVGYVDDDPTETESIDGLRRLGRIADLPEVCRRYGVQDIVVGAEAAAHRRTIEAVLPCLRRGCRVTNEATFYEKATGQILVDEITPHWFLFADLEVHSQRRQATKRAFDLVTAILGTLLALPLVPFIAMLIKLDDGGPILYAQKRTGQNGKPFTLFKFRTMKVGAENGHAVWAVQNDPRVTRVGRLLRKTRLDELPQLYNVLIGQMSVVGPRPERPDLVAQLSESIPYFNERHLVKPGLTGWAQINFRYASTVEDAKRKLQFDLYYIKHMSFELDLMILLRTLGVFVRGAC